MPSSSHREYVKQEFGLPPSSAKLDRRYIEKPWGRAQLPAIFEAPSCSPIGEMWFASHADLPLLAKYLFTSERLSVQVHPDDTQARVRGLERGKAECWYVIEAEPEATIGLGLRRTLTREELRDAALDGSIVDAIEWRPVRAGDFFYVPPGTIHAIGGGISLLEFQQNSDATYRLYDYGRPRPLHLDDGVAVSALGAYPDELFEHVQEGADLVLVDGAEFVFVHCHSDSLQDRRRWILPLDGVVHCNGETATVGECLLAEAGARVESDRARLFIGAASSAAA